MLVRIPRGMSLEDARRAGIAPPEGCRPPPRPPAYAALRTARAIAWIVPGVVQRLVRLRVGPAPSTRGEAGAEQLRRACARALERLGVALQVRGAERVPAEGGLVFMWNQESHLDHLVLGAAMPRPFLSLYNNEVAAIPLYGAHMKRTGHFHVDRRNEAQWRESIARAAAYVRGGGCVLVSPEGTRSWDGRLLPMKRGAFQLARDAAAPIVCVTVIGGRLRLPRGAVVVRPGAIRVVFSAPFPGDERRVVDTFEQAKREHAGWV